MSSIVAFEVWTFSICVGKFYEFRLQIPMMNEHQAKLCFSCLEIMQTYSAIKEWMTVRQSIFVACLQSKQDPPAMSSITEKSEVPEEHPDKKIYKRKKRTTNLEKLMTKHVDIPREQKDSKFCTICNKHFSYKFTAISHLKMVHLKIKVSCSECCWKLSCHAMRFFQDFICDICSYGTSVKCNLVRHMQRHHIEDFSRRNPCADCGKVITNKYQKAHRLTTHSDKYQPEMKQTTLFECCKTIFTTQSRATRHCMNVHGGRKIYKAKQWKLNWKKRNKKSQMDSHKFCKLFVHELSWLLFDARNF